MNILPDIILANFALSIVILIRTNQVQKGVKQMIKAISDFAAAVSAFFDRVDTAITDLQGDVKNLTDQIAALQNSPGTLAPEDQALLDGIQQRAGAVADKLDALDALTPPVAPPPAVLAAATAPVVTQSPAEAGSP